MGYNNKANSSTHLDYTLKPYGFLSIDNYIYLYHTGTLIAIQTFPEQISDSTAVTFSETSPLQRSAPIYSYTKSGPRSMQINLKLHRDMMGSIFYQDSSLSVISGVNSVAPMDDNYVDVIIREIQAAALPNYGASEKMVDPPLIAVRFGNDIYCKGVVTNSVGVTYSGPILADNRYALVDLQFSISEVDPYDAETVMQIGSYRISNTLDRGYSYGASGFMSSGNVGGGRTPMTYSNLQP